MHTMLSKIVHNVGRGALQECCPVFEAAEADSVAIGTAIVHIAAHYCQQTETQTEKN